MQKLTGKTAIVTGSSRGIGRAVAERLGADGASVVVTFHGNRDKAEEAVAVIKENGVEAIAVQLDMRDLKSVRALFEQAKTRFGQIDILVNNRQTRQTRRHRRRRLATRFGRRALDYRTKHSSDGRHRLNEKAKVKKLNPRKGKL